MRRPGVESRVPEIHRLWKERGVAFPLCIASGYPSVEGRGGILLGVAGHPSGLLLYNARDLRRPLDRRASRAGGLRARARGRDEPGVRADGGLVRALVRRRSLRRGGHDRRGPRRRMIERLEAPREAPLFVTLFTIATHPPVFRPPGAGPEDAARVVPGGARLHRPHARPDLREPPADAAGAGHDRVVAGDHSTTNPWQSIRLPRLGTPNAGENWTTLLVAGPRVPAGNGPRGPHVPARRRPDAPRPSRPGPLEPLLRPRPIRKARAGAAGRPRAPLSRPRRVRGAASPAERLDDPSFAAGLAVGGLRETRRTRRTATTTTGRGRS